MRMLGLTSIVLAAGLALGAPVHAQNSAAPAAAPAPAAAATQQDAGTTGGPAGTSATVAAPTPAAIPDPTLDAAGKPLTKAVPGMGQPQDAIYGLQEQVTPNGREAHWFHNTVLLPLITVISIFVLILLIYVIIRYRRAANPTPSRTSHNTAIEIVWTLAPVLILIAIAVPSIRLLAAQFKPAPDNAVTLKAIGNQWFWSYEYPDHGDIKLTANMLKEKDDVAPGQRYRTDADGPRLLATDTRVVLPVGVPIRLVTTAQDVIHSWAVPAFWIKLDAVPGRLNETSFIIEKPGLYFGQCSELCGARHAYMPIAVEAVPPAVFARWVASKGGKMPGANAAPQSTTAAGNDAADDTSNGMTDEGAPTVNATAAPAVTNKPATQNPAGLGQADHTND
ncbi:cytochrome c oxidase subunit II [Sphingomonas psychrotolerans]|uniref:Cytochrome c oxidase subunit 2 n=1 Tax=Sphingomonas psychrotolerans TaxID=1327635 RepID=A0ABU3N7C6_9SPHN|nr:cytochrome c oxidase subunit II [Sphingomonas psychrotolerans]MDT8760425.1 cytochrome c oxidase subunit II [Sphingomonas psychrotolerans]